MVETLNQLRYGRKLYRDATDVPRHVQPTLIFIYRAWKLKVLLKERKGKKEGEGGKKKKINGNSKVCEYTSSNVSI